MILTEKGAEDAVPEDNRAAIVGVALVVVAGMVELVSLGGIEKPTEHARNQGQVGVTEMRGRQPEYNHHPNHFGAGAKYSTAEHEHRLG